MSKIDARFGAFGIIPESLDGAIITGNFWSFDVDRRKVNIDWLNLFTSSIEFYKICEGASSGTTHRKYLDENKFLNFEIALPEVVEQNEFVASFQNYQSSFQKLETELNHQQKLLQQLRGAILQDAVQGKLTDRKSTDEPASKLLQRIKSEKQRLIATGKIKKEKPLPPITPEEIPFELPDGWVWCRLGEIISCERGRFSARPRNDPRYYHGEFPFIQIGDLSEEGDSIRSHRQTLNVKGLEISKLFPKGTVALAIVGGTIGNTGVLSYDMCFPDSIIGIKDSKNYSLEFVHTYIKSKKRYFRTISYSGGGQPNIKLTTITECLFPLPPLQEQQRIVEKAKQLIQIVSQLGALVQQSQAQLKQLSETVLAEAFEVK